MKEDYLYPHHLSMQALTWIGSNAQAPPPIHLKPGAPRPWWVSDYPAQSILPILYLTTSSLNQSINPSLNKQISTPKMPIALPTYLLALSAGNIAVLAFGWGKLVGAAPIAIPLRRQRGRIVASMKGMVRWSEGPIPRGGHAE
jgi:hypothetical protein